jgi:uncharacterized protein (DUF169 family)
MNIYLYNHYFSEYEFQDIVIVAKSPEEAIKKLKAYLKKRGETKLAAEVDVSALCLETDDVFETFGKDG